MFHSTQTLRMSKTRDQDEYKDLIQEKAVTTNDLRKGTRFNLDGVPYMVMEAQHVKPGKGPAFVRTKLKNLLNDSIFEKTFRAGEKVQPIFSESVEMEYLYEADGLFYFMAVNTYEQIPLSAEVVGQSSSFLTPNTRVKVQILDGSPIGLDLPNFVILDVIQTEPGVKGDTVTGASKPATLETGFTLQVPLFIDQGQKIRVDTREGKYVERA